MDHFALEGSLRAANARVAAGQRALLEQRTQVRTLEQSGLDASLAKALLGIYEQSQAVNVFDQQRQYHARASATAGEPLPVQDDVYAFLAADDVPYREAA